MVDNENCFHLKNRYTKASFLYILHWDYLRQLPFLPLAAFFYHAAASALFTSTFTLSISSVYVAAFDMPVSCSLSAAPDAGDFTSVNGVPRFLIQYRRHLNAVVSGKLKSQCVPSVIKDPERIQLRIRLLVVHRVQVRRIRLQEEGHQHVVAFLCQRHSLRQGRQLPVNAQGKLIRHQ